jgi:hypothetical protein
MRGLETPNESHLLISASMMGSNQSVISLLFCTCGTPHMNNLTLLYPILGCSCTTSQMFNISIWVMDPSGINDKEHSRTRVVIFGGRLYLVEYLLYQSQLGPSRGYAPWWLRTNPRFVPDKPNPTTWPFRGTVKKKSSMRIAGNRGRWGSWRRWWPHHLIFCRFRPDKSENKLR